MERKRKRTAEIHSKELQPISKRSRNERSHKNMPLLSPKKEKEIAEEVVLEIKVEENVVYQCRGCRMQGVHGLFSIHEKGLKDLFSLLTGIEIKDDDPAPNFLCQFCRSQLMSFSLFRTICIESNSYFIEKMNENLLVVETKREIFVDTMPIISKKRPAKNSSGDILHRCNECSKAMQRRKFLWHWRYTHAVDAQPSTCTKCQKQFPSVYKLEYHQRTEHGILKCYVCDQLYSECSKSTRNVNNLHRHIRRCDNFEEYTMSGEHRDPYRKPPDHRLACTDCDKKIPLRRFKWHWCYVHQVDEAPSTCEECSKVLPSIYKLEEHQRIKHGLLKCNLCNNREPLHSEDPKDVSKFLFHMNKHCNEVLNTEEIVEKEVQQEWKKEFKVEKIACNECQRFIERRSFLWHWRYEHAVDERKSFCKVCKRTFPSVYKLEKHQRLKHNINECYNCGKRYMNFSNVHQARGLLGRHIRRCDGYEEYKQSRWPQFVKRVVSKKTNKKPKKDKVVKEKPKELQKTSDEKPTISKKTSFDEDQHLQMLFPGDVRNKERQERRRNINNLLRHIRRCDNFEEYKGKREEKNKERITCNECQAKLQRRKFLWHFRYEHAVDEKKSFCCECKREFLSVYKLEKHLRLKHNRLQCYKCYRIYSDPSKTISFILGKEPEITKVVKEKAYKLQKISDENSIKSKLAQKTEEIPAKPKKFYFNEDQLTCNECSLTIGRRKFFRHWRMLHLVEQPSTCRVCTKVFLNKYQHEEHQRKEHGILKCFKCTERPIECTFDQKKTKSFLSHLAACKKDLNENPFECKRCYRRFISQYYLSAHEKKCLGIRIPCNVCGMALKKSSYRVHMERHSTAKNQKCRTCGRGFNTKPQRNTHERLFCHSVIENVICDYCGNTYKNKFRLQFHIKNKHMDPNPDQNKVQCSICGLIVTSIHSHMISHGNDRKYRCKVEGCTATFKRPTQLKRHTYTHSKKRPYNCTLCEIGYYSTNYLRGHYKRDHGVVYPKGKSVPCRKL